MIAARLIACLSLAAAGCGDNRSGHSPSTGPADAAAGEADGDAAAGEADGGGTDAGGQPDGGGEPVVVIFDNADGTFVWTPEVEDEFETWSGTWLDVTRPADAQPGTKSPSAILFYRRLPSGLGTYGGMWFRGCPTRYGPNRPCGADFAAGESWILDGIYEGDVWDDLTIEPPLAKGTGDTVGPADIWKTPEVTRVGVHAGHYNSPGTEFADDQVWFTGGTIGVRFELEDGVHYGFVELAFEPDPTPYFYDELYIPVRWGYQSEPDTPLVIPP